MNRRIARLENVVGGHDDAGVAGVENALGVDRAEWQMNLRLAENLRGNIVAPPSWPFPR